MEPLLSKVLRRIYCSQYIINKFVLPPPHADRKTIFLTFDDGPTASIDTMYTEDLLDLLKKYKVTATFFSIGKQLKKNKPLVKRITSEGHSIGNHTYSHKDVSLLSYNEIVAEIDNCQTLIEQLQPRSHHIFRPPRGHIGIISLFYLLIHKYKLILWSVDSMDSHGWSPTDIIKHLKSIDVTRKIILFHDDADISLKVLNKLIPHWIERGFSFSKL